MNLQMERVLESKMPGKRAKPFSRRALSRDLVMLCGTTVTEVCQPRCVIKLTSGTRTSRYSYSWINYMLMFATCEEDLPSPD